MEKINELNNVRKLATIAKILDIQPIEGADNIEKVFVRGWQCVAKKNEFHIGDLCVYVEIDSIMPDGLASERALNCKELLKELSHSASETDKVIIKAKIAEIGKENTRPEFEFLRSVKFHIKTRRILGEISQGICFPLSILPKSWDVTFPLGILPVSEKDVLEDDDVTNILGVTQYIPPDPAIMGGDVKGELQAVGFLVSDEERLENLNYKYEEMRKFSYFVTEKLDGTSFAAYLKNGEFGVCGRNVNYKTPSDETPLNEMNVYWKVAKQLDIENKMRNLNKIHNIGDFVFQGELVGEGIQGNIYKLKGQTVRFYNAFDIKLQEYWNYETFIEMITSIGLNTVPILSYYYTLPERALDLLEKADVTTTVFGNNPKQLIEGLVFIAREKMPATLRITRSSFGRLSFKAKSRTFDMNKNK
jgi:RNA ligase (TIGR02306 family)